VHPFVTEVSLCTNRVSVKYCAVFWISGHVVIMIGGERGQWSVGENLRVVCLFFSVACVFWFVFCFL